MWRVLATLEDVASSCAAGARDSGGPWGVWKRMFSFSWPDTFREGFSGSFSRAKWLPLLGEWLSGRRALGRF